MIQRSKRFIKNLPRLRNIFAERDHLRVESERLRVEREQVLIQRDRALAEAAQLRQDQEQARGERDCCLAENQQLRHERDRCAADNQQLRHERDAALGWKESLLKAQWAPPGHYYSAVPALDDLRARADRIWRAPPEQVPGIDLNESEQLELYDIFTRHYRDMPRFPAAKAEHLRYHYENQVYPYGDAIPLHCMIRHLRPRRIIEVGSGYSSAVILDTNELFFNNSIACTFIEPYPDRLRSLLKPRDSIDLIDKGLQDVDLSLFSDLGPRDILFIDSTHTVKCGGDVNWVFFEILPALARGVSIHFHDVFYPFEYPQQWVMEGRQWAEDYLLRAFLQYNQAFKIQYFNTYLVHRHRQRFESDMPLCVRCPGGSIWLRKV